MDNEKKEMVELINNKFTINDIQMLTALTNLYNSLPNQCGVIDGGMVNVQQRDGSFKEEPYNFKNDGLWAFISRFWYNHEEIDFTQNRDNVITAKFK